MPTYACAPFPSSPSPSLPWAKNVFHALRLMDQLCVEGLDVKKCLVFGCEAGDVAIDLLGGIVFVLVFRRDRARGV